MDLFIIFTTREGFPDNTMYLIIVRTRLHETTACHSVPIIALENIKHAPRYCVESTKIV